MGRVSKTIRHLKKVWKDNKERASYYIQDRIRFILSIFYVGMPYSTAAILFLLNNIMPPGRTSFYKYQPLVVDTLLTMANLSCKHYFDSLEPNSTISIDASWSHRRNARQCIVEAIDDKNQKIVDFIMISKNDLEKALFTNKSSNMMEFEGLKLMLPRLKNSQNIIRICKDGDVKFNNLIQEIQWNVNLTLDTSHRIKNYDTIFRKYNKECKNKLSGLRMRVKYWLQACLEINSTTDEKLYQFMNGYQHYLGNHTNCPKHLKPPYVWKHRNDPASKKSLLGLLKESSSIIADYIPGVSTSLNENFHSIKARMAPKFFHWGQSWEGRMAAAILEYNNPHNWLLEAMESLKVKPLSISCMKKVSKYISAKDINARRKRDPIVKKKTNERKRKQSVEALKYKKDPNAHM